MRLCEIPGPFIRSPFLVTKYDQGWNTMATTGGNVQMLNWQLRVQLPHLLKMMLKLETLLFFFRVLNFGCFSVWMSIRRIRMRAPIRHGADLTIQNHTNFRNHSSSLRLNKNSSSFVQMGSCSLWQKQGAPFAGGANGYVQDRQHAVG